MQKEAIQAIVNSAKAAGIEDTLVVYDDNTRIYRVKSETSTGYFDDANEVYYSFNLNDNPNRNTQNDTLYLIEACTYDHITSIYAKVDNDAELKRKLASYSFDEEEVDRIVKTIGRNYQASGYNYTAKNEDPKKLTKAPYMQSVEMGLPYKPYVPKTPNESEEDGD